MNKETFKKFVMKSLEKTILLDNLFINEQKVEGRPSILSKDTITS